ncbi:MAG: TlpA disulfide reductase family protein [Myxococcota bacterium]
MQSHRIVGAAWLALIGGALLWLGVRIYDVVTRPALIRESALAPRLALQDLEGRSLELGEPSLLLLDFWHHACRPCLAAFPVFERLQTDYGPRGLGYVGIHVGDELEAVRAVTEGLALDFALDGGEVARAYGVHTLPTLVLVDRERRVRKVYRKGAAEELLRRDLDRLLEARHAKRHHPFRRQ